MPNVYDYLQATTKPVAVGFGISKPEHVKQVSWRNMLSAILTIRDSIALRFTSSVIFQVAGWGADGVIVGSAMVKLLGEAKSPEEGLKELEAFARSLKAALP